MCKVFFSSQFLESNVFQFVQQTKFKSVFTNHAFTDPSYPAAGIIRTPTASEETEAEQESLRNHKSLYLCKVKEGGPEQFVLIKSCNGVINCYFKLK